MTAPPYSIGSTLWPGLAKVAEEAGELLDVIGKIIGNGGSTTHYDGTNLAQRLCDELGDVEAAIAYLTAHNLFEGGSWRQAIEARRESKFALFQRWHAEQAEDGVLGFSDGSEVPFNDHVANLALEASSWCEAPRIPAERPDLAPLRGHDLACWCPLVDVRGNPVPCHADVLLELVAQ
jgi:NTP pyrophosphatase (non-canonical NTP hydrolase)